MPLNANFIADFSSFINACADATKSTAEVEAAGDTLARSFSASVQSAAGSLQSVGTGIADFGKKAWEVLSGHELAEFGHAVTEFAGDYIADFARAEQATTRLERALKNAGETSPTIAKDYAEMAEALQKVSTYSTRAITDAQAIFTTIGEVGPENMKRTLEAAMNLATFMGTDVVTAAKLMQKAAESNGEAVGRLKVYLGSAYEKGMSFDEILGLIEKKMNGQFADALNTTEGHLKNLQNQMEGVNEQIGQKGAESLNMLIDAFHKLPAGVQTAIIATDSIAGKLGPVSSAAGNLAQVLGTLWPEAMATAGAALVTFGEGILTFLGALVGWPAIIIGAIVVLAIGIYKYWDEIVAATKKMYEAVKNFLTVSIPEAFTACLKAVENWFGGIKHWLQDEFGGLVKWVTDQPPLITAAFQAMYMAVVGHSSVPDMIRGIGGQFNMLDTIMVNPALNAIDTVVRAFDQIQMPLMFSGMTMPSQAVKFANVFSSTSALTETPPGTQITLNMTGMLGTDDPQTRQIMSDLVSNAVMQGMRGGRLLGTA